MRLYIKILLLFSTTMAGCIAYIPSTTSWRSTPKVVFQICVPAPSAGLAEIAYYHPNSIGVGPAVPYIAATESGQLVFERSYEDQVGSALGVNPLVDEQSVPSRHYIFLTHQTATAEWSQWVAPNEITDNFPKEIWQFKHAKNLPADVVKSAPKIRFRREMLNDFDRTRRSRERYSNIPSC